MYIKQKRSHFHFLNGWPYIVYHTALFVIILHYIMMTSHCSVEQHTFIVKLLSRAFRKVNDDITSYKINYNTIQNGINSSFQVRVSHWE